MTNSPFTTVCSRESMDQILAVAVLGQVQPHGGVDHRVQHTHRVDRRSAPPNARREIDNNRQAVPVGRTACGNVAAPVRVRDLAPPRRPRIGSPVDPEQYDYVGSVLWQAHAGHLDARLANARLPMAAS
jgi:hypothetical protein